MAELNFDETLDEVQAIGTEPTEVNFDDVINEIQTAPSEQEGDMFDAAIKDIKSAGTPEGEGDPTFAGEIARAAVTGVTDFANAFAELPEDLGLTDDELFHLEPFTGRPQTMAGEFGAVAVQFLVPFGAFSKGITWGGKLIKGGRAAVDAISTERKATILSRLAKPAAAGALTDFTAFSPSDPNLSAILREHAELQDPITEFLATDANDPDAVNRLRNTVEGLGLGISVDAIMTMLGKGIKYSNKTITNKAKQSEKVNAALNWGHKQFEEAGLKAIYTTRKIEQRLFDQFAGVKYVERLARKIDPDKFGVDKQTVGTYEEFRLLSSIGEVAKSIFTDSTVRISKDGGKWIKTGKGLNKILQESVDRADSIGVDGAEYFQNFLDLLKYKRAKDIRKYYEKTRPGKEISGGIAREEVSTQLDRIQALPYYKHMLKDVDNFASFNKRMVRFMQDSGVLDEKSAKKFLEVSDVWVPFYRKIDVPVNKSAVNFRSLSKNPARRKMQERTEEAVKDVPEIDDVLANMVKGYSSAIEYAMKNRARVGLYNMLDEMAKIDPTATVGIFKKASKRTTRKVVGKEQLIKILKGKGIEDMSVLDELDEEFFNIYGKELDFKPNTDVVWRDGKAEYYEIEDSMLQESLSAMGTQQTGAFWKYMTKFGSPVKNLLTRMVTLNPGFFLGTNLMRDMVTASIQSRSGLNPWDIFRNGMKDVFNKKEFNEYLRNGGGFGHAVYGESGAAVGESWNKYISKHGLKDPRHFKIAGSPEHIASELGRMATTISEQVSKFEHASRMTEYKRLLKQGYAPRKAALLAREVATDFGNRGSSQILKNFSAVTPFLNASMQGLYRYMRAIDLNKVQKAIRAQRAGKTHKDVGLTLEEWNDATHVWQRVAMYVGLPTSSLWAFVNFTGEDRKEAYYALPEHVRNTNWAVPLWQDEKGDWTYSVLPKPFEYGGLINVIEKSLDDIEDNSEKTILADYLIGTMSRITHTGDMSGLPHLARVPTELYLDRKFTGAPIVGNLTGRDPEKTRVSTSATARAISQGLEDNDFMGGLGKAGLFALTAGGTGVRGTSPVVIDHIINSYLGSLGNYAIKHLDNLHFREVMGLGDEAKKFSESIDNPFMLWTSRFIEEGPLRSTSHADNFYNRLQESGNVQKSLKNLSTSLNEFDQDRYDEMIKDPENQVYLEMYPAFSSGLRSLAQFNKQIKMISEATNIPGEEKLKSLDDIYRVRNALLKDINKIFESLYGQKIEGVK